jgi:hypothetical protein
VLSIDRLAKALLLISAGFAAVACGGGGGGGGGGPGPSTISGSVSGLVGTVVLQDNGGDNLTLTSNGSFNFTTAVPAGQSYAVTILTQPTGPDCTVTHGTGTATGSVVSVSVACVSNPATFYLPLAAQPPPGTSVGTTGLFVISSKEPGVSPISIFTGATKPIGYSLDFALNAASSIGQGQPTALAFSSLGAAAGDHLYAVDLTANSSLLPVQISNLTFPNYGSAQNCSVVDAYGSLTDPASAFFIIAVPTDPINQCGGASSSIKWYLVHLADAPATAPVELPPLNSPLVALYHASGELSGFLMVDQSNQLDFFPNSTFTNPTVLLSGVNSFGAIQGPLSLFTQVLANPTYAFLAVQSKAGSFSLYRIDDSGKISADLYDFQGSYDDGVLSDTSNLYVTDSYGTSTALIEKIVEVPLNGSAPAMVLFQYQPTDNEPYYLVGSAATSLVLTTPIPNPSNGPFSTELATLPIGTPATPTVIANFANSSSLMISAGDILVTQTTEMGTVSSPTFTYSTEIVRPDGTVVQPLQSKASFVSLGPDPLLEIVGVTEPSGFGGGSVSVVNLAQPSSPTLLPLKSPSGTAFALPAGSEFVSSIPVTPMLGWIRDFGATTNSQFVYELTTNTIASVSIPNAQLGLVFAPTQ